MTDLLAHTRTYYSKSAALTLGELRSFLALADGFSDDSTITMPAADKICVTEGLL